MRFSELSTLRQLAQIRPYAMVFATRFGLRPVKMRVANHGYNTTFRVTNEDGQDYALRVNINSVRQPEELRAEVAWVGSLAGLECPIVAVPKPALDGEFVQFADWPWSDRRLAAVCYTWLPGRTIRGAASVQIATLVGQATRELHAHAGSLVLPGGARFHEIPGALFGRPLDLGPCAESIDLGPFREVAARAEEVYRKLRIQPRIPIHFDLHFGNMKFGRDRVYVFDFDDAVLGWPAIDSSVTHYYWRAKPNSLELDKAYWATGVMSPEAQGITAAEHEMLVAARGVFLANELVQMVTSDVQAVTPRFIKTTELRLTDFLATGRLDCSIRA